MLTDDVGPVLAEMFAKVNVAEEAYNSTKKIRDGFKHHEAEERLGQPPACYGPGGSGSGVARLVKWPHRDARACV